MVISYIIENLITKTKLVGTLCLYSNYIPTIYIHVSRAFMHTL